MKKINLGLMVIFVVFFSLVYVSAATTTTSTNGNPDSLGITLSAVSESPNPAIAGNILDVDVGIANSGSESATNLILDFQPDYPFTILPGTDSEQSAGPIVAYQGQNNDLKIVHYQFMVDRNAPAGIYNLKVSYHDEGSNVIVVQNIPIQVKSSENAEIIHIDQTVLVPGKLTPLKFVIHNVGNSPLKDLTFSWTNDAGVLLPVGSDNTQYISYIDVGNSSEITYQVIPDTNANAGLYKLNLNLKYYNSLNNSESQISTIAGVYVGGGTDFEVAFSDSTSGTTSFTIANVGSNPASSVSVAIPDQRSWRTSGSNSMIIGNLNKGDYTVASFKLQQTSGSTGVIGGAGPGQRNSTVARNFTQNIQNVNRTNALTIEIAYTDTMGVRETVEKTVNIISAGNSTGGGSGFSGRGAVATQKKSLLSQYGWYFAIVIILIAGFIFYRRYKSKHPGEVKIKEIFKNKKK